MAHTCAPAAKCPMLLARVRREQNLSVGRRVIRSGKQGKALFRRCWHMYKSVLNRSVRFNGKRSVRMGTSRFFAKLYRVERYQDEPNWAALLQTSLATRKPKAAPLTDTRKLSLEYLVHVLQPGKWYSLPCLPTSYDAIGEAQPEVEESHSFFQILDVRSKQHKPKLVKTLLAHDRTFLDMAVDFN